MHGAPLDELGCFCLYGSTLTANRDALPGRYQCLKVLLDGLHRIPVIALELKKLSTIRHGNLTGTTRAPIATGEDEPRLFRSPPLRGNHLNGANYTRNTKTNIGKDIQLYNTGEDSQSTVSTQAQWHQLQNMGDPPLVVHHPWHYLSYKSREDIVVRDRQGEGAVWK